MAQALKNLCNHLYDFDGSCPVTQIDVRFILPLYLIILLLWNKKTRSSELYGRPCRLHWLQECASQDDRGDRKVDH